MALVVERTFAWLHGFRRLLVRYERRADMHEGLLRLACCLICDTRMLRSIVASLGADDVDGAVEAIGRVAPQGRPGTPEEIAAVVCFLASDAASFVNGVGWAVDGGALATMGNG